jgi:hypothetical protein
MPFETLGEPAVYVCDYCGSTVEFSDQQDYPVTRPGGDETLCHSCADALAWRAFDADQHLSGIHPPGGRVDPTEPVKWPIAKPGGIGPPPSEVQQRWAAAIAASQDEVNITLELTERQADAIAHACEAYGRLYMGQLEDPLFEAATHHGTTEAYWEARPQIDALASMLLKLPGTARYSLTAEEVPQSAKLAWEVRDALQIALGRNLWPAMRVSDEPRLPKATRDDRIPDGEADAP